MTHSPRAAASATKRAWYQVPLRGTWHQLAPRLRRAARALGLLVPRRRVAARGARRARRRARLRRARAHRPRRRLRLARVRARGEALRRPPDHRRRGDARRAEAHVHAPLRDAAAATRTSAASSPTRTRGHALPGRSATCCPPRRRSSVLERHAEGLVALSGCARHGLGVVDANGAARLARAFPGAFYVELQRPYERGDARRNARLQRACRDARASRPSRPATCTPTTCAARGCRTHSSRSRTAPRSTAASASGAGTTSRCCSRRRRCSNGCRATRRSARARSPTAATFDLTQELGYRYPDFSDGVDPADVQLRAICDRAFAERYRERERNRRARARATRR